MGILNVSRVAGTLAATRNAVEIARFGGLQMADEHAPFVVLARDDFGRLRRYFPDSPTGPPVLCVPPSLIAANIYDVSPASSAVRTLKKAGLDPWVLDFGSPEHEVGGLSRTLSDHTAALSRAVGVVNESTGQDVHVVGYSQAGLFTYQATALRRSAGVASIVTLGTPMRWGHIVPSWIPEEAGLRAIAAGFGAMGRRGAVPGWVANYGFRLMDPFKSIRTQLDFILRLHDREQLLKRESQRRFLEGEGWVAWPGPAVVEFAQQVLTFNRLVDGGLVVDGTAVSLADVICPILTIIGDRDGIAPPSAARAVADACPGAEVWESQVDTGHYGLVVGSKATDVSWPAVSGWVHWRSGAGEQPHGLSRSPAMSTPDVHDDCGRATPGPVLELAFGATLSVARQLRHALVGSFEQVRGIVQDAAEQLPRLVQLERVSPATKTSLGLVLDQQAAAEPDQVLFLFEDRAYTRGAAKERIDAVVSGLISIGVRRGEHVGVLMAARPSAIVVVAAISRIGAVAVLLRPGADIAEEASLGAVSRVICEPPLVQEAERAEVPVHVLGSQRTDELPDLTDDLERIDPASVVLPAWYEQNPGRARDVAFILFTGEPGHTRVNRVTNRRWLTSGMGTATASALTSRDTVYGATPLSHPSGLLVALGGAVCGGARFALARNWDAPTFYEETHRYGVSVVVYTWSMLSEVVECEPVSSRPAIRLFVGYGMPPALWRRVQERFPGAGVLEWWSSLAAEAVLVNVGDKIGSLGRSLPGTARVRVVQTDEDGKLLPGPNGLAVLSPPGVIGTLMVEVDPDDADRGTITARRGVFAPNDAWLETEQTFFYDYDGDYWLAENPHRLLGSGTDVRSPAAIRDALELRPAILEAAVYGQENPDGKVRVVAAVRIRPGARLPASQLNWLFDGPASARPDIIRVVSRIPRTVHHRPTADGLAHPNAVYTSTPDRPVWSADPRHHRYVKVTT